MPSSHVRPFRRADRDQLTALVNAHIQAVVPGLGVSVNRLLSQLEREPGEFVVDPWVVERTTLVAEQRGRVSAAALLLRYADTTDVAEGYRGAGEVRWLCCWPDAPYWSDSEQAGAELLTAAVEVLRPSRVRRVLADGALPAPGVYGIPEQWPHIERLLLAAGFRAGSRTERVFLADLPRLHRPVELLADLVVERSLGTNGTRLTARQGDTRVGYVEVERRDADLGLGASGPGWADIGNLWVEPAYRRRGVGTWLLGRAADWLALGHIDRLLDYAVDDDPGYADFLLAVGFHQLTRTRRRWELLG